MASKLVKSLRNSFRNAVRKSLRHQSNDAAFYKLTVKQRAKIISDYYRNPASQKELVMGEHWRKFRNTAVNRLSRDPS